MDLQYSRKLRENLESNRKEEERQRQKFGCVAGAIILSIMASVVVIFFKWLMPWFVQYIKALIAT
jgi:hypothetical protein